MPPYAYLTMSYAIYLLPQISSETIAFNALMHFLGSCFHINYTAYLLTIC